MQIKSLRKNMTLVDKGGYEILFSYQTPVVIHNKQTGEYYQTARKYSVTTSRHINEFLGSIKAKSISQDEIDRVSEDA